MNASNPSLLLGTGITPALNPGTSDGGTLFRPRPLAYLYRVGSQLRPVALHIVPTEEIQQVTVSEDPVVQPLTHRDAVQWIKDATGLSDERIARLLGVSRQTVALWNKGSRIRDTHRQRLFATREILGRAQVLHPRQDELVAWLDTPRGALGETPAALIEQGRLGRARALALSTPSSQLVRPGAWVTRPVPDAFHTGAEPRQEPIPPDFNED